VSSVCKSWRQALRRVWKVPFICHTAITDALSNSISIFDILYKKTLKFIRSCLVSGNDVVNFVARNGVYRSRMSSCVGRNVQFCCERYRLHLHDVLRPFSFDDMLYVGRPTVLMTCHCHMLM